MAMKQLKMFEDKGDEKSYLFKAEEVKESRAKALVQIVEILDKGDVDNQFKDRDGRYHSSNKFIVSWIGNWNGIPSEFSVDKNDAWYESFSGYGCVYAVRSLIHEKQLGGYKTIEQGLLVVGLKLCTTREKKIEFFEKYVKSYNERVKNAAAKNV